MKLRQSVLLAGLVSLMAMMQATAAPQAVPRPQASAKPATTLPVSPPVKQPIVPCGTAAVELSDAHRLILVPFENNLKNQDPAISDMALDTLQLSLLKPENRVFRLIGRKYVKSILSELAFSESALSDPKNALKLGKLLSANLMLTGTVSAGKIHTSEVTNKQPIEYTWATVEVNTALVEIETGEVLYAGKASGTSKQYPTWEGDTYTSIILEAVEQASTELAGGLITTKLPAIARPEVRINP